MNSWKSVLVLAALVPLSSACVMVGMSAGPGDEPGQIPPRMTRGEDGKGLEWDNPAAFGPVPPKLEAKGFRICRDAGYERATGYHPGARNLDGTMIKGGGFFCVGKAK